MNGRGTVTGFRQTAFKGGAGTGGVYINGRFVVHARLRAAVDEFDGPALGQAVPDWMHDYHANLIGGANANYIRWMHVTPQVSDVRSRRQVRRRQHRARRRQGSVEPDGCAMDGSA